MPGKNYFYETNDEGTHLVLRINPEMLETIKLIDEKFLSSIVFDWAETTIPHAGWKGKCPLNLCPSNRRNYGPTDLPAYIVDGEREGYVFHCCCCKQRLTAYKLLKAVNGVDSAEEYAQKRWDAGELCGGGWNCPLPQKIRDRLLSEKAQRREAYRRADQERKARNYQKKYGLSSTESA